MANKLCGASESVAKQMKDGRRLVTDDNMSMLFLTHQRGTSPNISSLGSYNAECT